MLGRFSFCSSSTAVRHYSSTLIKLSFFNSPETVFREMMKPHLSFEECANLFERTNTKSMSLTTLMITLCSKHKRSEEDSRKYIEALKHNILNFDEGSANTRTIDIAISTLVQEEAYDDVINLVRKLGNSSLASLKSFRLDQILKVLSSYSKDYELDIAKRIFSVLLERKQVSVYAYNYYAQCLCKYEFEEGMSLLHEMNAQKIKILDNLFISALIFSVKNNKQNESRMICSMIEHYKTSNKVLLAIMVNFYNKCKDYDKAIEINRSVGSDGLDATLFNCLIQSYIGKGDLDRAIEIVNEMQQHNISPDAATLIIILTACADNKNYDKGLKILSLKHKVKHLTIRMMNACINFYNKCEKYDKAIEMFESVSKDRLDATSFNCLIQSYIGKGDLNRAIEIVNEMQQHNISPDTATLTIILTACADNKNYDQGLKMLNVFGENKRLQGHLFTSIINFYNKCEKYDKAIELFESVSKDRLDTASFNCLIQSYIGKGDLDRAFSVFNHMKECDSCQNIIPDVTTYLVLLMGCAVLVSPTKGEILIEEIQEKQLDSSEIIKSAMLTFYSNTFNQKKTNEIITETLSNNPSIISYNCILASYARHGQDKKALSLFNKMIKDGVQLNGETITIVLNALSHTGMVEQAKKIYNSMESLKVGPSPSHKTVMIDVFARAGLFNQAEQLIGNSTEPIYWRTLMAGCRKYNNVELAEKVFEILTKIEPSDASPYILLSNIYMLKGNTSKANEIRDLIVQRGIKKIPGIVYHEDEGTTYQFISGSNDYPLFEEVEKKRKEIYQKIINAGYVPDTRWVTNVQLMSEEEKIDSLCRHAEKVAISHAFVLQPNRKRILLTMNLRVCNDCHNAAAYISKVMNVEIVVRDANRYHHFKNGKCSCNDYW